MIDLGAMQDRIKAMPNASDVTTVTRRCLEQMVAELSAARSADQNAAPFGLKGKTL
jgi:hypothetical protein